MRTLRSLSVGEVLATSLGVYREAFVPLLMVTIVTQGIPLLWSAFTDPVDLLSLSISYLLLRMALMVVLGAVGSAASTFIVSETYLGRSLTMGQAFGRSVALIGRILSTGLLVGLVAMAGFILFIIPGIIALCGLLLATPALVLESLPSATAALGRSWRLSSGLRGRIFVVLFVGGLLLYLPLFAISTVSAMVAGGTGIGMVTSPLFVVVSSVLQLLVYPLFYVAMVVLYYDARVRKEAFDLEILAQTLLPA